MAFLSGGDVALDVSIETLSTLLAPLMIPTLLSFLAGQYVSVPAQSLFLSTLRIVVVPIILGVLVHSIFGKKIDAIIKIMPLISQAAILLIVGAVVSANHANIFTAATALVIPVVMLHNLCGYALGLDFQKSLVWKNHNQKAITFEVGYARLKSWSNPCHEIFRATSCHPINYLQYLAQYLRFHPLIMVEEPFKK